MQIIDITCELSDRIKTYKSDPKVRLEKHTTISTDGYATTKLSMGSHSGTHIDAQSHVVEGGQNVTDIPLGVLIGKCYVVDASNMTVPENARRVLLKGNTEKEHTLNVRQAQALLDAGVRLVGTDGLSIGNDQVHEVLLQEGCAVLELLELSKASAGSYTLCALPLKIAADGAPVRACLIEQSRPAK